VLRLRGLLKKAVEEERFEVVSHRSFLLRVDLSCFLLVLKLRTYEV